MADRTNDLVAALRKHSTEGTDHDALFAMAADEIERLRAALLKSVEVIRGWHNMEIPVPQRSELWDIYWRNAPEIKQIRDALSALRQVDP